MAEETNLERNLRRAAEKRAARKKAREDREAAEKAADSPEEKPAEKAPTGSSLLESIRKAFSSEDDIKRIDAAVDAVTGGVKKADEDANTDHKRKK